MRRGDDIDDRILAGAFDVLYAADERRCPRCGCPDVLVDESGEIGCARCLYDDPGGGEG